ncbi:MAG: NADH-quinone oxidoreductase subunit J [Candidatus Heimdallarchaeota archaeon]|nr:MAG: NADH-quinone oxidoreductase subunit J [Candidatus Heimdallarchaeota archaeon]
MALIGTELFHALEYLVLFLLIAYTTGSAFLAVTVKSVYHAVLWLIFTLLGVAMIFLLYAESALLLVIQMIVYAGGITILMLFAISLSGKKAMFEEQKGLKLLDWRLSFAGGFILLVIAFYILSQVNLAFWQQQTTTIKPSEEIELIGNLARTLFTVHGGTLLVLGFLLLAAMLGSVYLVKKEVEDI